MTPSTPRRLLALWVCVTTAVAASVLPVAATERAVFSGRVLQPDGVTPRNGVVVTLLDMETEQAFRSEPTNDEGAFRIDSAPAGSYRLGAETPEGGFLARDTVEVRSGANPPLALTLAPGAQGSGAADEGIAWWKWLVGGLIFVTGALAIDDAGSDVEETPSDF